MGCLHLAACSSVLSPGRKMVVSFTTKYTFPHQIEPRILKLSIRRRQSNLIFVLIFCQLQRKRLLSCHFGTIAWFHCRLYCKHSHHSKSFYSDTFSFFLFVLELGGITKQLMTGPSGNTEFCFPSTLKRSPWLCLGEHRGSWGNKTHCLPWGQSL